MKEKQSFQKPLWVKSESSGTAPQNQEHVMRKESDQTQKDKAFKMQQPCGWVPLLFTWYYHNTVNQLYSNMNQKVKKRIKSAD